MSATREWLDRHRGGAAKLATAVSLATTVEPELLRTARLKLCPGIGVEAEGLVWFSPLVASRGPSGITLHCEALQAIWDKLQDDQVLLESVRELIAGFHSNISPALKWEEEIVYWALRNSAEAPAKISGLLQTIVKTLLEQQHSRMAIWAERALPRLPAPVRNDPAFIELAQAAFERGGRLGSIAGATNGPSWLKPSGSDTAIGVRLFGRAIEFSHPPAPEALTVSVPSGSVIKMLVSNTPDFTPSAGWPRQISLAANTIITESIDLVAELFVRPAGGRTFAIAPARTEGAKPSICLVRVSPNDEDLAGFLESQLISEFDILRPNATDQAIQIANRDVFLCVSSGEQASGLDSREVLAKQECRRIVYVAPPRESPYEVDTTSTVVDFRQPAERATALNELKALLLAPNNRAGSLFGVPSLPESYVERPQVFAGLQAALLQLSSPLVILDGDAGSGRSTLAAAVARDCAVRRRFPNGVYWIYGNTPTQVSGEGRLFIFDYTVPTSSLILREGESGLLYTKRPGFSDSTDDAIFSVGPWSKNELAGLIAGDNAQPFEIDDSIRDPATLKLRAAFSSSLSHLSNPEVFENSFIDPDIAASIARLGIFVPDTELSPLVYGRAFDRTPSPETLKLLQSAGLIWIARDHRIVIRESLRTVLSSPAKFPVRRRE